MPFYDIAGLVVEIKHPTGRTEKQARPYLCKDQEGQTADMTIDVTEQRVTDAMAEHPEMNRDDWYYMLTGSDFYTQLLKFRGILLHSSCVVVDGAAYAFSADSGTGKSTHTALWLKHFGNRAYMLNDDKPAIRLVGDRVYACGTPWSGKYDYSTPGMVPLAGICFLERAEENLGPEVRVVGTYMCQGKMPQVVRDRYEAMEDSPRRTAMLENFDRALSHPDQGDLAGLKQTVTNK